MTLGEIAEIATDDLGRMLAARGFSVESFPARRHDESGWSIGHVVGGAVLTHQIHTFWPVGDTLEQETQLQGFVQRIISEAPSMSAWLRRVDGRENRRTEACGLYLRWVINEGCVRVDTLIGHHPMKAA